MTRPIGPDGLPPKASPHALHLATDGADGPRRTVSILRDLSPGQVRLGIAQEYNQIIFSGFIFPIIILKFNTCFFNKICLCSLNTTISC